MRVAVQPGGACPGVMSPAQPNMVGVRGGPYLVAMSPGQYKELVDFLGGKFEQIDRRFGLR